MRKALFILALCASPAAAQIDNPGMTSAAVQAMMPPVCSNIPPINTLTGAVGVGTPCTPPSDRTTILDVQTGNTTLAANCTFSISFARTFSSSLPFVYAAVVETGSNQMPCKIQTRSSTGATGICAQAQGTVLTLAIVTTGLTLLPFGTTCVAGTPVMFVGKEPSQ